MSICPPCGAAADAEVEALKTDPRVPEGHDPSICRDHAIQPHGCACAHGPVGTATNRKDQIHA